MTAFKIIASEGFVPWLQRSNFSLAFTTYQAGKLVFLGTNSAGGLSVFERTFPRAMALGVSGDSQSLLLSTQYQLFRFDNLLEPGQTFNGYDALYAPHASWITGNLDIHGAEFSQGDRPVFVNTLCNCLAEASSSHSFKPIWKPDFISGLSAADKCHLNGMAWSNSQPSYVTCFAKSDTSAGWREIFLGNGLLIDVTTDEIVVSDLSMPHSPRVYESKLWLLNSATGEFGYMDKRKFVPVCFCPGYARGLAMVDNKAVIGLSQARDNAAFKELPVAEKIGEAQQSSCGLMVVDLSSGQVEAEVSLEGPITEVFDIAVLHGVRRPSAIGFKGDEIEKMISIET